MERLRKFLIEAHIIQCSDYRIRLNPYHPLSYIVLLCTTVAGTFKFGFKGIKEELKNGKNPFKYH